MSFNKCTADPPIGEVKTYRRSPDQLRRASLKGTTARLRLRRSGIGGTSKNRIKTQL
jgi:hypothetical protein